MADLTSFAQTYSNAGSAITTAYLPANNYKAAVSSKFGTRELAFYKIAGYTGVEGTTATSNGTFANILRGVQRYAELYYVTTQTNLVIIAIADDTNNAKASDNPNDIAGSGTTLDGLKAAIEASAGGTATVTVATFA